MNALSLLALPLSACIAAPVHAAGGVVPVAVGRPSALEQAHAQALDSFRRARFSEAYGRFIRLAEAGHPASARYAIWMCENGSGLFGVPWDCAPEELEDWAFVARSMPAMPAARAAPAPRTPARPVPRR
ncbi:MAG: hypothetical protein IPM15_08195 [Betaproteobacteria bacterium]|nr:hypothetical protein [Betaproteobacteria bacterium]